MTPQDPDAIYRAHSKSIPKIDTHLSEIAQMRRLIATGEFLNSTVRAYESKIATHYRAMDDLIQAHEADKGLREDRHRREMTMARGLVSIEQARAERQANARKAEIAEAIEPIVNEAIEDAVRLVVVRANKRRGLNDGRGSKQLQDAVTLFVQLIERGTRSRAAKVDFDDLKKNTHRKVFARVLKMEFPAACVGDDGTPYKESTLEKYASECAKDYGFVFLRNSKLSLGNDGGESKLKTCVNYGRVSRS